ncbi:MAG TPA: C2 family cysteine protease [Elusimicrobiota bacterium]|nr:C2 family cysteine protease [Elusimicrobiota bacterium]
MKIGRAGLAAAVAACGLAALARLGRAAGGACVQGPSLSVAASTSSCAQGPVFALWAPESPALEPKSAAAALGHARAIAAQLGWGERLQDSFAAAGASARSLPGPRLQAQAPAAAAPPTPSAPVRAPNSDRAALPPLSPEPALAPCKYWIFDCHDVSDVKYEEISGSAYYSYSKGTTDISPADVVQGDLGDCYFMASLAAVAAAHPDLIRRMVRENADGTFSVTFYRLRPPWEFWRPEYEPVVVRVDDRFPVDTSDPDAPEPVYAARGQGGIWAMAAEKAYAVYKGSYAAINGILDDGFASSVLEAITGKDSAVYPAALLPEWALRRWLKAGAVVVVSTKIDLSPWLGSWAKALPGPLYKNGTLVPTHDYWVESVDKKKGTVTLGNPWGWGDSATITMEEFRSELSLVYVNPVR